MLSTLSHDLLTMIFLRLHKQELLCILCSSKVFRSVVEDVLAVHAQVIAAPMYLPGYFLAAERACLVYEPFRKNKMLSVGNIFLGSRDAIIYKDNDFHDVEMARYRYAAGTFSITNDSASFIVGKRIIKVVHETLQCEVVGVCANFSEYVKKHQMNMNNTLVYASNVYFFKGNEVHRIECKRMQKWMSSDEVCLEGYQSVIGWRRYAIVLPCNWGAYTCEEYGKSNNNKKVGEKLFDMHLPVLDLDARKYGRMQVYKDDSLFDLSKMFSEIMFIIRMQEDKLLVFPHLTAFYSGFAVLRLAEKFDHVFGKWSFYRFPLLVEKMLENPLDSYYFEREENRISLRAKTGGEWSVLVV